MKRPKIFLTIIFLLMAGPLTAPVRAQEGEGGNQEFSPSVSFSGLFYLTFEHGKEEGDEVNHFFINRGYLTARASILPRLSARITFDPSQDLDGDGRGDMEVRLKYAYAKYDLGDRGLFTGLGLEGGIVHMVWLDFEEHINLYRMRAPMFMERAGMFNSADFGLTLSGSLGEELPEEYRKRAASSYAGRHGSFAIGAYNGTGYHGDERNGDKVLQGRLTLRPLPDALPGLQMSGLAIVGKGNVEGGREEIPDWRVFNAFLSYQHPGGALTAQYVWGEGNQKGSWVEPPAVEPSTSWPATHYKGFSLFAEQRFASNWRLVAGFDDMEREPGSLDLGFRRVHGAIGYDMGRGNVLLLDLDRRKWNDNALPVDTRFQMVMQVSF